MKEVFKKLAEIATKLDEAGHREQADKLDAVMMQLASELSATAEAPFAGSANLTPEQMAEMQGREGTPAPATTLPPSVLGKVVIPSKTPEAKGFGFFGSQEIESAVKEGKVDVAAAVKALQDYLKLVGYQMIGKTLSDLIGSAVAGGYLPIKGKQEPEVYGGPKSIWQKLFGK